MRSRSRWCSLRGAGGGSGVPAAARARRVAGPGRQSRRRAATSLRRAGAAVRGQHVAHQRVRRRPQTGPARRVDAARSGSRRASAFLSTPHQLQVALGAQRRRRAPAGRRARPAAAGARRSRRSTRPSRADSSAAITMPQPTASPCSHSPIAQPGLDRVAEGVAEVQDRAQPGLALVLARRPAALISHERCTACASAAASRASRASRCASIQSRKSTSAIGPYLMTSARPALSSRGGRVSQRVQVAQHALRLVEGADHVLAERVVDRGLAAHRRIDLRQQRRRHLHEGHAAHVAGGGKAGDVADHAAAEREQHGLAVAALRPAGGRRSGSASPSPCALRRRAARAWITVA